MGTILHKIKNYLREYRRKLTPAPEPFQVSGTRVLSNILASILCGSGPRPIPQSPPRPFNLRMDEQRLNEGEYARVTTKSEIVLNERAEFDNAAASVSITPYLLMDDDLKRDRDGSLVNTQVIVNGEPLSSVVNPINVKLSSETPAIIETISEPFERELYASVEINVEIPETNDGEEQTST